MLGGRRERSGGAVGCAVAGGALAGGHCHVFWHVDRLSTAALENSWVWVIGFVNDGRVGRERLRGNQKT